MSTATLTKPATRKAKREATPDEVRSWAVANGVPIGTRGRISDEVRDQFNTAKKGSMAYIGSIPGRKLKLTLAA